MYVGSTAKEYLKNSDEIVSRSLPRDKVVAHYSCVKGAAKDVVLKFVSYTSLVIAVSC